MPLKFGYITKTISCALQVNAEKLMIGWLLSTSALYGARATAYAGRTWHWIIDIGFRQLPQPEMFTLN